MLHNVKFSDYATKKSSLAGLSALFVVFFLIIFSKSPTHADGLMQSQPTDAARITATHFLNNNSIPEASSQVESSFSCALLTLRPVENGYSDGLWGSSVRFEIQNNNSETTFLSRIKFVWPTILDYPSMFLSEFALNGYPHWQGIDIGDVNNQSNITDTNVDVSTPPNYFNNTSEFHRSIAAYETRTWTALLGDGPSLLAQYVNLNYFSGTTFYLFNPRTPSIPCVIGLALSPPLVLPAPKRNYYDIHTPKLTWSRVTWAQSYQIEIDDDLAFGSPTVASVAAEDLFFTPTLSNGIYYWHVRAMKNDVEVGNWSAPQSFVVSAP
jgi:hypothetical protein